MGWLVSGCQVCWLYAVVSGCQVCWLYAVVSGCLPRKEFGFDFQILTHEGILLAGPPQERILLGGTPPSNIANIPNILNILKISKYSKDF